MKRRRSGAKAMVTMMMATSAAIAGCGTMEGDDSVTEVNGALGSFGSWTAIPGGTFRPASPALATGGLSLSAFALGNDVPSGKVYSNTKSSTAWWPSWTPFGSNGATFATAPAAAGIDFLNGNEVGFFALAEADPNGRFFVSVSLANRTTIVQDWTPMPNAVFSGQPAIAATPSNAAFGPRSTLFLAGRGTDNRIWVAQNTIVSGHYSQASWSQFTAIPNGTFQTAPAIAWACPQSGAQPVMMISAVGFDNRLWVSKLTGSTWSSWTPILNGTFFAQPPALATSCRTGGAKESLVFARGQDARIYFDRDHGTGTFDPGFTVIGTQLFTDGPGATALNADASTLGFTVAARISSGQLLTSQASMP